MTNEKRSALVTDLLNLRAIVEQHAGADNIICIYALRPLADLYVSCAQYKAAEPVQREILRLSSLRPGNPILPTVDEARQNLAFTLTQVGKHDEAIELYEVSLALSIEAPLNAVSLDTAAALVQCLQASGRFAEALGITQTIVARVEEFPAGQLTWLMRLSSCYSKQGDYAKAAAVTELTIPLLEATGEVCCIPQLDVLAELYRKAGDSEAYDRVRTCRRFLADKHDF
jgi:tetratricopeptide (TPR) repeat protein